jgi:hypothetical protein
MLTYSMMSGPRSPSASTVNFLSWFMNENLWMSQEFCVSTLAVTTHHLLEFHRHVMESPMVKEHLLKVTY